MAASGAQLSRPLRVLPRYLCGGGIKGDPNEHPFRPPMHPIVVPCRSLGVGWLMMGKKYSKPIMPNVPFRKGQAKDLIYRLSVEERQTLLRELQRLEQSKDGSVCCSACRLRRNRKSCRCKRQNKPKLKSFFQKNPSDTPTTLHAKIALYNAMPFVGFGFLDNFIMILAGDYIDFTIGAALGISTLAAAALGNMVSDVAGIGSAWYVESIVERIGGVPPPLSPAQLGMMSTRWSAHFGRALGVAVGCILGMVPLLFLHKRRSEDKEKGETSDKGETSKKGETSTESTETT